MKELVFKSKNGNAITTSLRVAEIFEREHRNILRDVQNLSCSQNFRELNFALSSYTSSQNKKLPMYYMTKDGFSFLVMGYTGTKAGAFKEAFINAFNKIEEALKVKAPAIPSSFAEALELAAKQARELEAKNKQLELAAPKVLFADAVSSAKNCILIGQLAKLITQNGHSIGQNRLFKWLRKNGYLLTKGRNYNRPAQRYVEMGLFDLQESINVSPDATYTSFTPLVTGKGQQYFINKFLK
jgi:anti-repressor protein